MKKQNTQTFYWQLLELKLKRGETIKTLNGNSTALFFDSSHNFVTRQQFLYDSQAPYFLHALIRQMHFLFLTFLFVFSQFLYLTKNIFVTLYGKGVKSL
jgi:hypothetical protein